MYHIPPIVPDVEAAAAVSANLLKYSDTHFPGADGTAADRTFNVKTVPDVSGDFYVVFLYYSRAANNTQSSVDTFNVEGTAATELTQSYSGGAHSGAWWHQIAEGTTSITVSVSHKTSGDATRPVLTCYVVNSPNVTPQVVSAKATVQADYGVARPNLDLNFDYPTSAEGCFLYGGFAALSAGSLIEWNDADGTVIEDYDDPNTPAHSAARVSASGATRNSYTVSVSVKQNAANTWDIALLGVVVSGG